MNGITTGKVDTTTRMNTAAGRGVSTAGIFAQLTTYAKLVPFGAIALLGIFFINPSHFSEFNPSGESLLTASGALAPLRPCSLYLGLESATVPAGDVRDRGAHDSPLDHARHRDRRRCSTCSARSP